MGITQRVKTLLLAVATLVPYLLGSATLTLILQLPVGLHQLLYSLGLICGPTMSRSMTAPTESIQSALKLSNVSNLMVQFKQFSVKLVSQIKSPIFSTILLAQV